MERPAPGSKLMAPEVLEEEADPAVLSDSLEMAVAEPPFLVEALMVVAVDAKAAAEEEAACAREAIPFEIEVPVVQLEEAGIE